MSVSRPIGLAIAAALLAALFARPVQAQSDRDREEWPRTEFDNRTVELAQITSGGPPKDGIPALDKPRFVGIPEARRWLKPDEPVIVLRVGDQARAYPLQVMVFHEIVNDSVGGVPVAVTFCPLCNAAMAFDRRVGGGVLDFGTTGRLRMSDLVMYDRQTESWWQQFTGEGIVGRHAGKRLAMLPADITAFADFAASFPRADVLSRETGHDRPYGTNPYPGYDRADQPPFHFSAAVDGRLPPMERVLAVIVDKRTRLHPLKGLAGKSVTHHEGGGMRYAIFVRDGVASALDTERISDGRHIPAAAAYDTRVGKARLTFRARDGAWVDRQTGSRWNLYGEAIDGPLKGRRLASVGSGVHFAFAWLAFRPDSEIVTDGRR